MQVLPCMMPAPQVHPSVGLWQDSGLGCKAADLLPLLCKVGGPGPLPSLAPSKKTLFFKLYFSHVQLLHVHLIRVWPGP